ncbi:MAG: GerMN domain-containing protein [Desulfobacula sp.]|jgi:spore germination protein GerM|uniref:GerMN domain-containing protein n=1 Tax=Desulfobacula sp. TaxID=2593537 RepID=UPI001DC74F3C|nr:GerMN domain-containing protein [Desulfobacula sp.]MBT3486963.1 GerMN domain-containing protein [Desulfobacula sp.]MBT3806569.1 GerMN domain-containing protein [Desulfobacula sp.]MBT4026718.1 GerMN domain-containing protein [Desulfobacula sp.]MBT4199011.1 GerMN domain-containing protein [Desulfobacula sp.]
MKSRPGKLIFFIFLIIFTGSGICAAEDGGKEAQVSSNMDLFEGFVYYADKKKTVLKSVKKQIAANLDSHNLGLEILATLFKGPQLAHLEATWPKETIIDSFFITDEGEAYIDLTPEPSMMENMDTQDELLAIYSIVNSLTLNIPKIKRVKILIQGKDAFTLAGHIDLEYFYKTNMLMVK